MSFPPFNIGITPGPLSSYAPGCVSSEYRGSPNFLAWLTANLQLFQDGINCMLQFDAAFGLLTAVGAQLDVLGVIVGQNRTVAFQPRFGISPVLDDNTYRLLLRARVWQNHWDGRLTSLWKGWYNLFPGSGLLIQDNQNMTVSFLAGLTTSTLVQDLILNGYIIPRPQGVLYSIALLTSGWNTGQWNAFQYGSLAVPQITSNAPETSGLTWATIGTTWAAETGTWENP